MWWAAETRNKIACDLIRAACVALVVAGCGGRKIVPTKPVELNIPPDLAKAFEVKELPPSGTIAAAEPVKKSRSKRVKKASAKALAGPQGVAGPATPGFVIPNRRPPGADPLQVGERIFMDVTWLATKAGEFTLEVLPFKVINGRKVYDLKGTARTSDLFSLIYKAEDWVESFVDYEGWFPYRFVLHGDETKHIRDNLELFDHAARKQYVHINDNRIQNNEIHEEKGLKDLTPFSQDSLSALYYVRTQKLEDGATIHFPMTTNGNQWETVLTVIGREEVNTKMGYMKSIKTKIETRFKGVLQQQGDAFIWFSDDPHRYPVRFEAKVKIGWVAGIAKKIEPGAPEPASATDGGVTAPPAVGGGGPDTHGAAQPKRRLWFRNLIESISPTEATSSAVSKTTKKSN
jgi:hypothetical protein